MRLKQFSIVTVPIPFTDSKKNKKSPALVILNYDLFDSKIGHSVLANISSNQSH
jgi:hypothetical protein